jgi:outer membrane lipoprotein-sorting protein
MKYRLTSATDASTQIDGVIFVDQETGLLLRSEVNTAGASGEKSRVIVEARDLQLNPDRSEFDVPAGMKKVPPQEARQQIEGFVSAIGYFAGTLQPKR